MKLELEKCENKKNNRPEVLFVSPSLSPARFSALGIQWTHVNFISLSNGLTDRIET